MNDVEYANEEERVRDMIYDGEQFFCLCVIGFGKASKGAGSIKRVALQKCQSADEALSCPELKHIISETLRLRPPGLVGPLRLLGYGIQIEVTNDSKMVHYQMIFPVLVTLYLYVTL